MSSTKLIKFLKFEASKRAGQKNSGSKERKTKGWKTNERKSKGRTSIEHMTEERWIKG